MVGFFNLEGLGALLLAAPPAGPATGEFDRGARPRVLVEAAVLVPIVARREPALLFTRRPLHLSRHGGQISFPGGRREAGDGSALATALRETFEETGIDPGFVTVAGFLDGYETASGYAIQPVVGVIAEGFALAPDESEVEEIFEVPLGFLLDPGNCRLETAERSGRMRRSYVFRHGEHEIWGATAAIIVDLRTRLAAGDGKPRAAAVSNPDADRS